jgi:hypothetical protein
VIISKHSYIYGRAIAEAVSRWLPTTTARVRARVWQVEFLVNKVGLGQVLSEDFGFPYQNLTLNQLLHHHSHAGQVAEALRRDGHPSKVSCRLS